jgi:hypothetical protein
MVFPCHAMARRKAILASVGYNASYRFHGWVLPFEISNAALVAAFFIGGSADRLGQRLEGLADRLTGSGNGSNSAQFRLGQRLGNSESVFSGTRLAKKSIWIPIR